MKELISIHDSQIADSGGKTGIINSGLLESAAKMPSVSFGDSYLYENIYQMAAALMYHLVKNHPFYDANKRTAVVATTIFLESNGLKLNLKNSAVYEITIDVAKSNSAKSEIVKRDLAKIFEANSNPIKTTKEERKTLGVTE